jgi:hypothetical protein
LPPIKTKDGHTQKYFQAAGSDAHVYMPPLVPWQDIARDVNRSIICVEGEKKSAKGCLHGLALLGLGGLWNWRQKLGNGERLVIPTLDLFQWRNRDVLLLPDSDCWRVARLTELLPGFFALGQELISRGAHVQFVVLPDRNGTKQGFDDWMLAVGTEWESLWPRLERIALDDARLKPLAAWWQRWREREATAEAFKTPDAEAMETVRAGTCHSVRFPAYRVRFRFDRLTDSRGGVSAELTVHIGDTELLGETDIGLKSDTSRDKIARTLKAFTATGPWKRLLERACTTVLKAHRKGEPVIQLQPNSTAHVPFLVNPLIYNPFQSLMYAPGGSLKSRLALYVALLVSHGATQNGLAAVPCSVLYLDWELTADTVGSRLKALQTGHQELSQKTPFYRRCELPLYQESNDIAAHVAELEVRLLILDSAAMACGGDLASPDAAIKLQRALRTIGCASLMLAHVSKSTPDGQERSAYGTVFFRELARNVWELERTSDLEGPARIVLAQKKNNFGPLRPPMGLEFQFDGDATRVIACDPEEEPEFDSKLPLPSRIRNLLEDGSVRSAKDIAEALDASLRSVKVTLSRHKGTKWHQLGENKDAKWTAVNR